MSYVNTNEEAFNSASVRHRKSPGCSAKNMEWLNRVSNKA